MIPKFRVWHHELGRLMSVKCMFFQDSEIEEFELNDALMNDYITAYPDEIELMQSTGLKDKNGKEIFEGDVVRMRNPRDRRQIGMFQVVRVANSPMLGLLDQKLTTEIFNLYEHMRNYYEVKGNIYENPELLEDK
ncbi:YopX family protein [Streptococcus pneumoniae]|uniref:YopX family protein n=1 Tax=Streptococcus pneumoniae TaxID=1313 RepID=UPI000B58FB8A|nr:YopX family protein [Streptococcus pneumoniae]SNG10869.1 phage protein [Streptococcus pneumoniae]VPL79915.1 phage protein [Streptococcus pneumoniae]HET0860837.1 hypothetical protein [Streptococcus pneumoniae]HET1244060.1 hypothetical protein [Streptococcus pneumoniae]HET1510289.1 hypothetical protein [Streptococcus pneumoniae]